MTRYLTAKEFCFKLGVPLAAGFMGSLSDIERILGWHPDNTSLIERFDTKRHRVVLTDGSVFRCAGFLEEDHTTHPLLIPREYTQDLSFVARFERVYHSYGTRMDRCYAKLNVMVSNLSGGLLGKSFDALVVKGVNPDGELREGTHKLKEMAYVFRKDCHGLRGKGGWSYATQCEHDGVLDLRLGKKETSKIVRYQKMMDLHSYIRTCCLRRGTLHRFLVSQLLSAARKEFTANPALPYLSFVVNERVYSFTRTGSSHYVEVTGVLWEVPQTSLVTHLL